MKQTNVKSATGKLGILIVGNGAVATTFMTGVLMARKGLAKPVGAMTQYDKIRDYIASVDPKAFITFTQTNAVYGEGFKRNKKSIKIKEK